MRFSAIVLLSLVLASAAGLAQSDRGRSVRMHDIDGRALTPFAPARRASIVFFVATDCPVSNSYAPVIQRVCREYGPRGVECSLIYEDVDTHPSRGQLDRQVRSHLEEYGYTGFPAVVDRERTAATYAKASVTPQAFVIDRSGDIRYRGRIDNLYAAFGKTRQQITSHDLRDALDAVLAGGKVPHPETEALGCFITDPALLRKHDHE
jgi:thiol-disulfide isomerase/thioredoxin